MTSPCATALTLAAQVRYDRLSCDDCHTDTRELRLIPLNGWVADPVTCAACLPDGAGPFGTLMLAQGAETI